MSLLSISAQTAETVLELLIKNSDGTYKVHYNIDQTYQLGTPYFNFLMSVCDKSFSTGTH